MKRLTIGCGLLAVSAMVFAAENDGTQFLSNELDWNPLGFPSYRQEIVVMFGDPEAASSAERHLMLSKEDGRDGLASRSAVFAANADFDFANGRARIWVAATAGGFR